MKLNRKSIRKLILKEMAGMMGGAPRENLTFEKIADIHRFVEFASSYGNGRHWMFPGGVDDDTFSTLNALYVSKIARQGVSDPVDMQEYISIVMQIPGADLSAVNDWLNR